MKSHDAVKEMQRSSGSTEKEGRLLESCGGSRCMGFEVLVEEFLMRIVGRFDSNVAIEMIKRMDVDG